MCLFSYTQVHIICLDEFFVVVTSSVKGKGPTPITAHGTDGYAGPEVLSYCSFQQSSEHLSISVSLHTHTLFHTVFFPANTVCKPVSIHAYYVTILFYYQEGEALNFPQTRSYPAW